MFAYGRTFRRIRFSESGSAPTLLRSRRIFYIILEECYA
jgi:hypothetical protein